MITVMFIECLYKTRRRNLMYFMIYIRCSLSANLKYHRRNLMLVMIYIRCSYKICRRHFNVSYNLHLNLH